MSRIVVRSLDGKVVDELAVGALPVTIGRDSDNDIVLDDRRISRHHLKIEDGPAGARLVNLSRVSPMRVNGRKASIVPIQRRAEVEIVPYRVEIDLWSLPVPARIPDGIYPPDPGPGPDRELGASLLAAFIGSDGLDRDFLAYWPAFALLTGAGISSRLLSFLFWEQSLVTLIAGAVLIGPLAFALAMALASPFALLSKLHGGSYQLRRLTTVSAVLLAVLIEITPWDGGGREERVAMCVLRIALDVLCGGAFAFFMLRIALSIRDSRALGAWVGVLMALFLALGVSWEVPRIHQPSGFDLASTPLRVPRLLRPDPDTSNRDLQQALSLSLARSNPP